VSIFGTKFALEIVEDQIGSIGVVRLKIGFREGRRDQALGFFADARRESGGEHAGRRLRSAGLDVCPRDVEKRRSIQELEGPSIGDLLFIERREGLVASMAVESSGSASECSSEKRERFSGMAIVDGQLIADRPCERNRELGQADLYVRLSQCESSLACLPDAGGFMEDAF